MNEKKLKTAQSLNEGERHKEDEYEDLFIYLLAHWNK